MRGVVSLAAALAPPLTIRDGSPFPARDLILFLTFIKRRSLASMKSLNTSVQKPTPWHD